MTNTILLKSLNSTPFKQNPCLCLCRRSLLFLILWLRNVHWRHKVFIRPLLPSVDQGRAYIFSWHFFLTRLCIVRAKIIEKVCVCTVQCTCSIDLIWDSLGWHVMGNIPPPPPHTPLYQLNQHWEFFKPTTTTCSEEINISMQLQSSVGWRSSNLLRRQPVQSIAYSFHLPEALSKTIS